MFEKFGWSVTNGRVSYDVRRRAGIELELTCVGELEFFSHACACEKNVLYHMARSVLMAEVEGGLKVDRG